MAVYVFATATVESLSVLREYERNDLPLETWAPFVWEYSSGIVVLALLPLILLLDSRFPFRGDNFRVSLPVHALATIPFSALHVAGMVGIRKIAYALSGRHYDFGDVPTEMLYEYRKDFLTYFFILFVFYAFRYFRERASGAQYEQTLDRSASPQFKVRHRGLWNVIDAADIDWAEAAGNYVLLHVGAAVHPLRDTMKEIERRLGPRFARVHRSAIVNRDRVAATQTPGGGQRWLVLTDGTVISCGRSYRAVVEGLLLPYQPSSR